MSKTQQVLFFPIHGLQISNDLGGEISIGRVTFVAAEKIPRIRKRLGLKNPISHYRERMFHDGSFLFSQAPAYACIQSNRDPADKDAVAERNALSTSFWLLASSFFPWEKREHATMSITPHAPLDHFDDWYIFDKKSDRFSVTFYRGPAIHPQSLDREWKRISNRYFFPTIKRLANGAKIIDNSNWKASVLRAATLCGQSLLAKRVSEAFLCDMIAIETLLTQRGDKFPETLIDRVVSLFGWLTAEDPAPWRQLLERLYQLRCSFVHDGHHGEITGMDLYQADNLIQNLLSNICRHIHLFQSKQDLIDHAKSYGARRALGMKLKRPKTISYSSQYLTEAKIAEINNTHKWSW